jgi:hypothetical protein
MEQGESKVLMRLSYRLPQTNDYRVVLGGTVVANQLESAFDFFAKQPCI